MKSSPHDHPSGKNKPYLQNTPRTVFVTTISLVLLLLIPLYYFPLLSSAIGTWKTTHPPSASSSRSLPSTAHDHVAGRTPSISLKSECDVFRGEWVPNPRAPYYTNLTCWAIHENQNCMKYGRTDTDFLKWRWKPDRCELPVFNPAIFLDLLRGRSLAFLGDSVGRNHMQSLMCLLSRVTYPVDASKNSDDKFTRWIYPEYNFTVANFWSPFLVKAIEADPNGPTLTGLFNLYLDEADGNWTSEIEQFDYVIVSAGHWFFRPSMYYQADKLVGCHYCLDPNITDRSVYHGYRHAFRTTFRFLNALPNYKGTTFLRTFAPQHFENGEWNNGGDCKRKRPFRSNETRLEGLTMEMYMTQLEEFRSAKKEATKRGRRFELLDVTEALLLRPDGHPSSHGHLWNNNKTMYNDCVHWCLPGPIDNLNDFLLEMLKRERRNKASASVRYRS